MDGLAELDEVDELGLIGELTDRGELPKDETLEIDDSTELSRDRPPPLPPPDFKMLRFAEGASRADAGGA